MRSMVVGGLAEHRVNKAVDLVSRAPSTALRAVPIPRFTIAPQGRMIQLAGGLAL